MRKFWTKVLDWIEDRLFGPLPPMPDFTGRFKAYQQWADEQVCQGCGIKAGTKPTDPSIFKTGRVNDHWVTETWCGCNLGKPLVEARDKYLADGMPRVW